MYIVLIFMLAGVLSGFLFRNHKIRFANRIIITLIWALLFLLGIEVGLNETVIRKFHLIGLEAIIIAIAGTLGSVVAAKILWNSKLNRK